MQKKIPTLAGIIIIIVAMAILFGGVFVYQYISIKNLIKQQQKTTYIKTTEEKLNINQKEGCVLLPYTGKVSLNTLPYYSQGQEDFRGGMVCKFVINPKLPIFTFNFIGQDDNTLGNINIMEGSKIIQTINGGVDPNYITPETSQDILKPVDANFDGYKDLPILTECGATGNCGYDFYLYDPNTNQFVNNSFLTNLGTFNIDNEKQQITASSNSSVADWEKDIYQYKSSQYLLIEKDISTWNRSDDTVTIQTYKLQNGKMNLVSSVTNPFE